MSGVRRKARVLLAFLVATVAALGLNPQPAAATDDEPTGPRPLYGVSTWPLWGGSPAGVAASSVGDEPPAGSTLTVTVWHCDELVGTESVTFPSPYSPWVALNGLHNPNPVFRYETVLTLTEPTSSGNLDLRREGAIDFNEAYGYEGPACGEGAGEKDDEPTVPLVKKWSTFKGDTRPLIGTKVKISPTRPGKGAQVTYEWYVGRKVVSTGTRSLTIKKAYRGKRIVARVAVTRPGSSLQYRTFTYGKVRPQHRPPQRSPKKTP